MRRRAFLGLLLAAPTLAVVGLDTVTPAWARPRPVPPSVTRLRLHGIERGARSALRTAAAPGRQLLLANAPRDTEGFSLLGVTWLPDPGVQVAVQARTRSDGRWSGWLPLEAQGEHRPDDVALGQRDGTAPRWVGPSDGVQVRVDSLGGPAPRDVRIELVDPGTSAADGFARPRSTAFAETDQPAIITRAEWGADETIRNGSPSYNSTVKVGFVHHTASSNDYTQEQAAAMVRGIYAYHVQSNGWSDIGYNYLVDRYGRAYEGRAGGLDRFVVGAHTGGFNQDSFAVSLLGDFTSVPPSEATLDKTSSLLSWKLGAAYREPTGTAVLVSAGGGTSRYPAGQSATFSIISGHRDAGNTSCPGATTYARLGDLRAQASRKLGAGFVDPALAGGTTTYARGSKGPVVLSSSARGALQWTATVSDSAGELLQTRVGSVAAGGTLTSSWDLTDAAGEPVKPGTYVVRLTGSGEGDRALPWSRQVVVKGKPCRGTPLQRAACTIEKLGTGG